MRLLALVVCAACSSPSKPAAVAPPPAPPADAAVDASPDAGVPEAAAAWRFRYATAQRTETWTLRFGEGHATIDVQTPTGTTHYFGTAVEGDSVKVEVATASARLALDCKPAKKPYGAKCNDAKAKPVDVLECFHPDFKEPMPFGPDAGIEYVVEPKCTGYRLISSP